MAGRRRNDQNQGNGNGNGEAEIGGAGAGNGGDAVGVAAMIQNIVTQMMQRMAPPPAREPDYLTYLDKMVKYKTPKFSGGVDPVEADEWRTRLERNFESMRIPAEHQKDIAAYFLEGDAYDWWKGVLRRDPAKVHDYASFQEEYNTKYFPRETRDKLATEFLELRQGSQSVRDYEAKFNRLKKYAGRDAEGEQEQILRFLRGIKPEIRTVIAVRDYDTLGQLVEKAAVVETNQEEEAKLARKRKEQQAARPKRNDNRPGNTMKACGTCGKMHRGECRQLTGACYRYGKSVE